MVANICDILLVDETRERRVDVASDGPPSLLLSYDSESLGRDGSVTLPITFQTGSDNREFLKRAHDVGAFESFEDRRRKSAKLDEQLECLQSVLPCSTKVWRWVLYKPPMSSLGPMVWFLRCSVIQTVNQATRMSRRCVTVYTSVMDN